MNHENHWEAATRNETFLFPFVVVLLMDFYNHCEFVEEHIEIWHYKSSIKYKYTYQF